MHFFDVLVTPQCQSGLPWYSCKSRCLNAGRLCLCSQFVVHVEVVKDAPLLTNVEEAVRSSYRSNERILDVILL